MSRHTSSGITKNTSRESIYVSGAAPGTTLDFTWFFTYLCLELWPSGSYARQTFSPSAFKKKKRQVMRIYHALIIKTKGHSM